MKDKKLILEEFERRRQLEAFRQEKIKFWSEIIFSWLAMALFLTQIVIVNVSPDRLPQPIIYILVNGLLLVLSKLFLNRSNRIGKNREIRNDS